MASFLMPFLLGIELISAQDWGTSGSWQRVSPVPGTLNGRPAALPPQRAYRHATSTGGYLAIPGNITVGIPPSSSTAVETWLYNIANNTWLSPFELVYSFLFYPPLLPLQSPHPFLLPHSNTLEQLCQHSPC